MKYIKLISIVLAFILAQACSEDFLEVENVNNLSAENFYQTELDFDQLLITCYMPLAFSNLYGVDLHVLQYALDDRVIHEQFNTQNLQFDATNGSVQNHYYGIYTGIYRCNLFLDRFKPEVITSDPGKAAEMEAQAHFLRGLYYWYAAYWFEVSPLLREPYVPNTLYPNSTQDSLYAFAEQEMQLSIDDLPVQWEDANVGRITQGAAKAFLAKLYMYRQDEGDWAKAEQLLGEIISSGNYALNMPKGTDSLDYVFAFLANFSHMDMPAGNGNVYDSEHNSEYMFDVEFEYGYIVQRYLPGRRSTGSNISWYNSIFGGFKNIAINDDVFPDEFEEPAGHPAGLKKDPRYYATFWWVGDTVDFRDDSPKRYEVIKESDLNSSLGSRAMIRKYYYPPHIKIGDQYSLAPYADPTNWRLMRYADVLLLYAEAILRQAGGVSTNDADALAAFNQVRTRAGMPTLPEITGDDIIHERDIEFAGEHQRYWDLVRWYKSGWMTIEEVRQYKPLFQERHVCLPIPLKEINNFQGVLKQNEKWLN